MYKIFKNELKEAIASNDIQQVRALCCLMPLLAREKCVEDFLLHLVNTTNASNYRRHLKAFETILYYGDHSISDRDSQWRILDAETEEQDRAYSQWLLLSESSSSGSSEETTQLDEVYKQGFREAMQRETFLPHKLKEEDAQQLTLNNEAGAKLATLLGALVGRKAAYSHRNFKIEEDKPITGPHLRFLCHKEELPKIKTILDVFAIPYYNELAKPISGPKPGFKPLITIPQTAFRQIHAIFEGPDSAMVPAAGLNDKLATGRLSAPQKAEKDLIGSVLFDFYFRHQTVALEIANKAMAALPKPEAEPEVDTLAGAKDEASLSSSSVDPAQENGFMLANVLAYISRWIQPNASKIVPYGMTVPLQEKAMMDSHLSRAQSVDIPLVCPLDELSDEPGERRLDHFDKLSDLQKRRMLEFSFLSERQLGAFDATAEQKFGTDEAQRKSCRKKLNKFLEYLGQSLSTYLPPNIRKQFELTAHQPSLPSSSLSEGSQPIVFSQPEGRLSLGEDLFIPAADKPKVKPV